MFIEIYNQFKAQDKEAEGSKFKSIIINNRKVVLSATQLELAMNIFAALDVPSNKFSEVIAAIPDVVRVSDGYTTASISKAEVRAAIMVAHAVPRSSFMRSQTASTYTASLATMTPLILYAFKREKKINYEFWDKEDNALQYAFPVGYYPHRIFPLAAPPELREEALAAGGGTYQKPATGFWLSNSIKSQYGAGVIYRDLQLWLCNAKHRVPGVMVLDVDNWDKVPKAMDAVLQPSIDGDDLPF